MARTSLVVPAQAGCSALSRQAVQITDHESGIRALERGRRPLPTVVFLAGVAGAAAGLVAVLR
ncbi:hypothetical protein ACFXKF_33765 [Streptomyces scopuliridis]|uniref:hypothetical protein n=1 Tax=Streptomyces scopuliridis TaxID=452529 RepID=UPI0036AA40DB